MNETPERLDDPVSRWMQELAAVQPAGALPDAALPDAHVLWWQAQALRRIDEQRRLMALLDRGEHIQLCGGATAAVLLLVFWVKTMRELPASFALVAAGCIALMGIAVALTLWDARRSAE